MHLKLPIKILFLLFFIPAIFLFFIPHFVSTDVKASDILEKSLKYTYTFSEDKKANVRFETTIENTNSKNLLKSYVFNITEGPYENLNAWVNGSKVSLSKLSDQSNRFQINFSNDIVKLNKDINIKVEYTTSELIDQYGNLLNLYIPYVKKSNDSVNISYSLNYPSVWGSINFASMRNYQISSNADRTIVTIGALTNPNGGYFSIGDIQNFDFKIVYDSLNSIGNNEKIALNVPQTTNNQELFFNGSNDPSSTILVDQYENQFIRFISPTSINLDMQLTKSIDGQKENSEASWKALYYIDQTNAELLKYYKDNFAKLDSNKDLAIFDKVTSDFKYKDTDITANQAIEKILSSSELNSLEFSVLLSNLYNLAGYKSRVVGGIYMGGDNIIEVGSKIWFWVEYVGSNGIIREIDPSLSSATGFDYFTNNGLSHIKIFNYADPLVNFSFGSDLQIPVQYKVSAISKIDFQNDVKESVDVTNDIVSKSQASLYSGTENNSIFTVKNTSSKVLNISKIVINGEEVKLNLETTDGYRKLLFPGEEITYNYSLKVPDWGFNGNKSFEVKVYANLLGTEELLYSNSFTYPYQSSELVIVFSWILKLLMSIIIVTIIYLLYKSLRKIHRTRRQKHT